MAASRGPDRVVHRLAAGAGARGAVVAGELSRRAGCQHLQPFGYRPVQQGAAVCSQLRVDRLAHQIMDEGETAAVGKLADQAGGAGAFQCLKGGPLTQPGDAPDQVGTESVPDHRRHRQAAPGIGPEEGEPAPHNPVDARRHPGFGQVG